jgi:predicted cupin superfamily sugar epimerase
MNIDDLKRALALQPLPQEGGYYAEIYRSDLFVPASFGGSGKGQRSLATSIYYLLTPDSFSALHRLASDEIWHFYLGDAVEMLQLTLSNKEKTVTLGNDIAAGMRPQILVPRRTWQGAKLRTGGQFALLGATVFPGFDFADFELGKREELLAAYPSFAAQIRELTR